MSFLGTITGFCSDKKFNNESIIVKYSFDDKSLGYNFVSDQYGFYYQYTVILTVIISLYNVGENSSYSKPI